MAGQAQQRCTRIEIRPNDVGVELQYRNVASPFGARRYTLSVKTKKRLGDTHGSMTELEEGKRVRISQNYTEGAILVECVEEGGLSPDIVTKTELVFCLDPLQEPLLQILEGNRKRLIQMKQEMNYVAVAIPLLKVIQKILGIRQYLEPQSQVWNKCLELLVEEKSNLLNELLNVGFSCENGVLKSLRENPAEQDEEADNRSPQTAVTMDMIEELRRQQKQIMKTEERERINGFCQTAASILTLFFSTYGSQSESPVLFSYCTGTLLTILSAGGFSVRYYEELDPEGQEAMLFQDADLYGYGVPAITGTLDIYVPGRRNQVCDMR